MGCSPRGHKESDMTERLTFQITKALCYLKQYNDVVLLHIFLHVFLCLSFTELVGPVGL